MDRETLADIHHALSDLVGYAGVHDLGERAVAAVNEPLAHARAAARLTTLPPTTVDIRFQPSDIPPPVTFSTGELARAAERARKRRAGWVNRDALADIVFLVHHLDGYEGVYEVRGHLSVVLESERAQARAASRLTALSGVEVNIVSVCRNGRSLAVTAAELAAAARRDEVRREAWTKFRFHHDAPEHDRTLFVVSGSASRYADAIAALSVAPLSTYGTTDPSSVLDMLAIHPLPHVILLDMTLAGTPQLAVGIRSLYPRRFGAFGKVQWIQGKNGLLESDVERILSELRTRMRAVPKDDEPFAGLRILVVETTESSSLAREVEAVAVNALVQSVDGWTALERLDAEQFDLVVAGQAGDVGLPSLVRFVRGCDPAPPLVIANELPVSTRMRATFPHIAHYFIDRPVKADDLRRVLRR